MNEQTNAQTKCMFVYMRTAFKIAVLIYKNKSNGRETSAVQSVDQGRSAVHFNTNNYLSSMIDMNKANDIIAVVSRNAPNTIS
eukprot:scaffold66233_cov16-Prasinocladus_malaysianus.AAC.1